MLAGGMSKQAETCLAYKYADKDLACHVGKFDPVSYLSANNACKDNLCEREKRHSVFHVTPLAGL